MLENQIASLSPEVTVPSGEGGHPVATLLEELSAARRRTDSLLKIIPPDLLFTRPVRERHRIAFYIGHLEAFDVNLLVGDSARWPQFDSTLGRLFAFGIDAVDGALPNDSPEDWPSIEVIRRYAAHTRRELDRWLGDRYRRRHEGTALEILLEAAIEHRLMHAETLVYMLNRLKIDRPLRPIPVREGNPCVDVMVGVPAGLATLGMSPGGATFGWDNEYTAHTMSVPEFQIDRTMVTNAQFLRFLNANGYGDPKWWSPADWAWREAHHISHPASWLRNAAGWHLISTFDAIPFQGDWPVYVSHAEASAYARWACKRLPSEAEWHRAAYGEPSGSERPYPWGDSTPSRDHGNFGFDEWDPAPVDAYPAGDSFYGVTGLLGNGWEWTSTAFAPFPGFKAHTFYPGYSAAFFDNRHFVLKGGSPHTATRFLRRSFRNWFQPHYPHICAGFRCVAAR